VIVVCRRDQPVAELRGIAARRATSRPVGLAEGRFTVPDAFFDPLPECIVVGFGERDPR
jgi:antitoxin (DNA-binding transcriptional repressor) of toxin-antitoxin stability system